MNFRRLAFAVLATALALIAPEARSQPGEKFIVSCRSTVVDLTIEARSEEFFLKMPKAAFRARLSEPGDFEERCQIAPQVRESRGFDTHGCSTIGGFVSFEPSFQSLLEDINGDQNGHLARESLRDHAARGTLFSGKLNAHDLTNQESPVEDVTVSSELVCRLTVI